MRSIIKSIRCGDKFSISVDAKILHFSANQNEHYALILPEFSDIPGAECRICYRDVQRDKVTGGMTRGFVPIINYCMYFTKSIKKKCYNEWGS